MACKFLARIRCHCRKRESAILFGDSFTKSEKEEFVLIVLNLWFRIFQIQLPHEEISWWLTEFCSGLAIINSNKCQNNRSPIAHVGAPETNNNKKNICTQAGPY